MENVGTHAGSWHPESVSSVAESADGRGRRAGPGGGGSRGRKRRGPLARLRGSESHPTRGTRRPFVGEIRQNPRIPGSVDTVEASPDHRGESLLSDVTRGDPTVAWRTNHMATSPSPRPSRREHRSARTEPVRRVERARLLSPPSPRRSPRAARSRFPAGSRSSRSPRRPVRPQPPDGRGDLDPRGQARQGHRRLEAEGRRQVRRRRPVERGDALASLLCSRAT